MICAWQFAMNVVKSFMEISVLVVVGKLLMSVGVVGKRLLQETIQSVLLVVGLNVKIVESVAVLKRGLFQTKKNKKKVGTIELFLLPWPVSQA